MRYGKTYEARTLIWSALRRNPRFTVGQIQKLTTVPERTVYDYVRQLQAAGYVAEVTAYSAHEQIAGELELRSDTGPHAPRVVKGELLDPNLNPLHFDKRTRIWTLIRHMGRVDVDELSCATDGEQNPGDISRHLKFWADQGYLRVISRNRSGKAGERIRYQLVFDPGPHAPLRRRDGSLFDPNDPDRPTKGKEETRVA